ncbi:hypothetical protein [Anthocerotibacter panamensis]|uniref:hypothetical protein n=1 Tax=Anthocerotibacter panamensis TaxID=2857077 RepID=UPI001C40880D|nr:hypothetical protein [Anthocerotibacter panamensis]
MSIYESRKPKSSSSDNHISQPRKTSTFKPPVVQAQPVEAEPPMPVYRSIIDDLLTNNPLKQVPGEPASGERRLSPIQIPSVSAEVQRQEQTEEATQQQDPCPVCAAREQSVQEEPRTTAIRELLTGITVQRQVAAQPGGGPDPECERLLGEILSFLFGEAAHQMEGEAFQGVDLKRGLIERHEDLLVDEHELYTKHLELDQAHPQYGSWKGHRDQYEGDRRGLAKRLNEWRKNKCGDFIGQGLPERVRNVIKTAAKWVKQKPPKQPRQFTALPEAQQSLASEVLKVLEVLGISVFLAGVIVAALIDPEPATKLALIGLTAVQIPVLLALIKPKSEQI